jgi:hypothetical protein
VYRYDRGRCALIILDMEGQRVRRRNGVSNGLGKAQLSSWAAYVGLVVSFYVFFTPGLPSGTSIPANIIYGVFALINLFSASLATLIDPADPFVVGEAATTFCYQCDRAVFGHSKHCTICHKCIEVFDRECAFQWRQSPYQPLRASLMPHTPSLLVSPDHCVWLNTCVGKHNIAAFYSTLVSAVFMLGTQFILGFFSIIAYLSNAADYKQNLRLVYSSSSIYAEGIVIGMVAFWIVSIVTIFPVFTLLRFHATLISRNLTTYEFIKFHNQAHTYPGGVAPRMGSGSSFGIWLRDRRSARLLYRQKKEEAAAAAAEAASIAREEAAAAKRSKAAPQPGPASPALPQAELALRIGDVDDEMGYPSVESNAVEDTVKHVPATPTRGKAQVPDDSSSRPAAAPGFFSSILSAVTPRHKAKPPASLPGAIGSPLPKEASPVDSDCQYRRDATEVLPKGSVGIGNPSGIVAGAGLGF